MEKLNGHKSPSANGRFGSMAAVTPQTILWEFARYYPAASSVEAATAPSRWDVTCHMGTVTPQKAVCKIVNDCIFEN